MSGTFAIVSGLASQILGPSVTVSIGGITLSGFEVPSKMPFGGAQRVVVHKMPGGGRVVDALGPDDRDISWSGILRTGDGGGLPAMTRAGQLDALRQTGNRVTLSWGGTSRQVVVSSFTADYGDQGYLIPYSITCVVVSAAAAQQPTLLSSLASDIRASALLSGVSAAVGPAVAAAQAALPVAAVLTKGSATFVGLSAAVGTASSVSLAAAQADDATLGTLSAAGVVAGTPFGGLANLTAATAAQSALVSDGQAAALMGRAATNLAA